MNIALFAFKNINCYEAISELLESSPKDSTVLMPIIKPLPEFYKSVIMAVKESEMKLKCFFVSAEGYDEFLKYADDLVITDNPVKDVLRNLNPNDAVGITWNDTPQCHFILHAVEDLAVDMWDITEELIPIDEEIDFSLDPEHLHDELINTMGKFVDLLAAFVANTVMESLSQAVADQIMSDTHDDDKKPFYPFDDQE